MIPVGHEVWVTEDWSERAGAGLGCLNLTQARLGRFMFHLLSLGGTVARTFALNHLYPRSFVQFAVTLPQGRKSELERLTGIGLRAPDRIVPQ